MENKSLLLTAVGFNSAYGTGLEGFYKFYHQAEKSEGTKNVEVLDPQGYLGTKGLKFLNTATKVYCNVAFECLKSRDLESYIAEKSDRVGLYDSSDLSNIGDGFLFDLTAKIEGPDYVSPMSAPNTIANASSSQMAIKAGIKGPNFTVCSGACSSLQAVEVASLHLNDNLVDYAIVGSTEIISKYQESVRIGENRQNVKKFSDEIGAALLFERQDSPTKPEKIYARLIDTDAGFKLKTENVSDVILRTIKKVISRNQFFKDSIDAVIISGGIHNVDLTGFNEKVKTVFEKKVDLFCPELFWGSGDNAGGLTGIMMAVGIFEKEITHAPLYIDDEVVSHAKIFTSDFSNVLIVNTDQTGYTMVSLITK